MSVAVEGKHRILTQRRIFDLLQRRLLEVAEENDGIAIVDADLLSDLSTATRSAAETLEVLEGEGE